MKNPFVTNGYAGPEYFCDRVEETQHITEMLTNVAKTEHSHPLGMVVSTHFRCGKVRIFYK